MFEKRPELDYLLDETARAKVWVKKLFKDLSPGYLYHCETHTMEYVYPAALLIAQEEKCTQEEIFSVGFAALFHDTGFIDQYANNERFGARRAIAYIQKSDNSILHAYSSRIYAAICNTDMQEKPDNKMAKILRDADLSILGAPTDMFLKWNNLLREEAKLNIESPMHEQAFDDGKWAKGQVSFFESSQWFTKGAKRLYAEQKEANIGAFKQVFEPVLSQPTRDYTKSESRMA